MKIKKIISVFLLSTMLFVVFANIEPVLADAVTDEIVVNLTVDSGISITSPADVTMSNMGTSINTSTGYAVWNVKTNDPGGYTLAVKASTSPAMRNGTNSFFDYTEATPGTPDAWSVDSGTWEFGFSALGTDVESEYGTGQTTCDNGVASSTVNSSLNFEGFTTSDETIATRSATTTTSGIDTRVCFAAGQNGVYAPAGLYQATITGTATTI